MKVEEDDGDIYSEFIIVFKFSPLHHKHCWLSRKRTSILSFCSSIEFSHCLSDKTKDQVDRVSSLSRRLKSRRWADENGRLNLSQCVYPPWSQSFLLHRRLFETTLLRTDQERDLHTNEIKTSIGEDRNRSFSIIEAFDWMNAFRIVQWGEVSIRQIRRRRRDDPLRESSTQRPFCLLCGCPQTRRDLERHILPSMIRALMKATVSSSHVYSSVSRAELSERYSLIFRSEKSMYYQWEYHLGFFSPFFSLSLPSCSVIRSSHCSYLYFSVHPLR